MAVINIMVVDDSAFMRVAIRKMLETDPEVKVIATADNGLQALAKLKTCKPDVITMDIEMPQMDGLTTLENVVKLYGIPVLMLSSLTQAGADATVRALALGAADFICKPSRYASLDVMKIRDILIKSVKAICRTKRRMQPVVPGAVLAVLPRKKHLFPLQMVGDSRVIVIGTSTGGPKALYTIVPQFPEDLNRPIFIVQHMPEGFTRSLAEHLNRLSPLTVKEGEDGEIVKANTVYIAPGSRQMRIIESLGGEEMVRIEERNPALLHNPSVDVTMHSVAALYQRRVIGVIMTGMGNDGAQGMKAIHAAGGKTVAEAEESCVVYGMPKAAVELTPVDRVVPLEKIVETVMELAEGSQKHG